MGERSLKAAVIGVGSMGRHHARLCADMPGVDLVGIVDTDQETRSQAAERYHTGSYADCRALLEDVRPDIAVVSIPTKWHYPVASYLMERGVHVLIEKPLALTVQEGFTLIRLAGEYGVKLGVGHVERFNPAVMALKQRLDAGQLGRIFQVSVRRIGGFPPRVKDVGVAMDLATHDLDVMRHLVGADVARISAEIALELDRSLEDLVCGLLRFTNGVIGLLNVNWLSPTKIRELTVHGERGMFVVNYLTQDLWFYENDYKDSDWESLQVFRGVAEGRMIRYPVAVREPLQVELAAFVRSVVNDEPFPVSGEDGLQAIILAQHLVKAGKQGTNMVVDADCTAEGGVGGGAA